MIFQSKEKIIETTSQLRFTNEDIGSHKPCKTCTFGHPPCVSGLSLILQMHDFCKCTWWNHKITFLRNGIFHEVLKYTTITWLHLWKVPAAKRAAKSLFTAKRFAIFLATQMFPKWFTGGFSGDKAWNAKWIPCAVWRHWHDVLWPHHVNKSMACHVSTDFLTNCLICQTVCENYMVTYPCPGMHINTHTHK